MLISKNTALQVHYVTVPEYDNNTFAILLELGEEQEDGGKDVKKVHMLGTLKEGLTGPITPTPSCFKMDEEREKEWTVRVLQDINRIAMEHYHAHQQAVHNVHKEFDRQ